MARPRYTAAKRAREIRKQEERARKLARKHGKAAARASERAMVEETTPAEALPAPIPPEDPPAQ